MNTIYTIGHGRSPIDAFIANLTRRGVAVVCDVRAALLQRDREHCDAMACLFYFVSGA